MLEATSPEKTMFQCQDCKQVKPIKHEGGTGYATIDERSTGHQLKICYACAALRTKNDLLTMGKGVLYLSLEKATDGSAARHWTVTDWPGTLRFPVLSHRRSPHNIGREQVHVYFKGPDGLWWHGKQIGDNNTICYVHRLARQDRRYA